MKTYPIFKKASSSDVDLTDGLMACWELDETSGTTAYDAEGSDDGTNTNCTVNQTGKIDKAYSFNGSSSYIDIPDSYDSLDVGTISMWVKPSTLTGSTGRLFFSSAATSSVKDHLGFQIYPANPRIGRINFTVRSASTVLINGFTNGAVTTSSWHHIVWVMDTTGHKWYIDGVEQTSCYYTYGSSSTSAWFNDVASTQNAYLGRLLYNGTYYSEYNGLMDQVAIWDKALDSDEVDELYNSGSGLAYSSW